MLAIHDVVSLAMWLMAPAKSSPEASPTVVVTPIGSGRIRPVNDNNEKAHR